MKKTVLGVAVLMLAFAAGYGWCEAGGPGSVAMSGGAAAALPPPAVAEGSLRASPDVPAQRDAVAWLGSRVAGRVVHATTREGIPFCPVSVRDATRREHTVTDREGRFATERTFGADCEVLAEDGSAAEDAGRGSLFILPTTQQADAAPAATRWERAVAFGPLERLEIAVALGPTYFVRTTLPPGMPVASLHASFEPGDVTDIGRRQGPMWQGAAVHEVPDEPGLYWCRFPAAVRSGAGVATLFVGRELWIGRGLVQKVTGVQRDPVVIALPLPGRVRGVVRDASGVPRQNVWVRIVRTDPTGMQTSPCRTAEDGGYEFAHVMRGPALLEVTAESIEPWRHRVDVVAGETIERDITLVMRQLGAIAGTITTASGAAFPACSVVLTSRHDTSVWREANIHWREVDGRSEATWVFSNVPVVEYDVALRTFAPCEVAVRRHAVVPPAERMSFHVQDRLPQQAVKFVVGDAARAPVGAWSITVRGDAGWQVRFPRCDATTVETALPIGQAFTWSLAGEALRAQGGRAAPTAGEPLVICAAAAPGFSAVVVCTDVPNSYPARGVEVFADGVSVGTSDAEGEVLVDLAQRPTALRLDTRVWRIFGDSQWRSDVDATTGAFQLRTEETRLQVYVRRVF